MSGRIAELLSAESIATAGTKTLDLNLSNPISRITVQVRLTNSTSTPIAHPAAAVSKIEVSDGSDLLFSMSGREALALNFYDKGALPFSLCAYEDNIMSTLEFHIDFGRYLWDRLLALDPKRFSNLQIRVTHNKALGASTPDAGTLAIIAHVFSEEGLSPMGFLMSKQVYSYALAANGQERITLPTDYDYRKILFGSLSAGNSPSSQLANVKLSIDNDQRVLLNNMAVSDILKMLAGPKAVEAFQGLGTGGGIAYFIAPTYEQYITIAPATQAMDASTVVDIGSGGISTILNQAAHGFQAFSMGYAPHGLIALPQGDQTDPVNWLKAKNAGSVALLLTAGAAVGAASTAEVILQQLRNY